MSLIINIEVGALIKDGWADIINVSSDDIREDCVVVSINEEMVNVPGQDLIDAIRRAMLS